MESILRRVGIGRQFPSLASMQSLFSLMLFGGLSFSVHLINTHHHLDVMFDAVKSTRDSDDTFDFIIVGAGSAGSVIANRLTKDNYKVLVLEAGGIHDAMQNIPALNFLMLNQPYIDWQYYTTPQKGACLAMTDKQCAWPRGKGLGGSDSLSFMHYMRGHRKDFESWASITKDARWHYENLLPFFKKIEDYKGTWENEIYHGKGGNVKISESPYTGMAGIVVRAGKDLNYSEIDFNEADFGEGFSHNFQTQSYGYRYGVYNAYLRHARKRKNMFVYKFSHVLKILFREKHRAYGVEYMRHGIRKTAFATKEVIISAGVLHSPQILMLSGIGPQAHLDEMGIPVKAALPVGKNLQDHVSTIIGPFLVDEPITTRIDRDFTPKEILRYGTLGKGPMSSTGVHASGFLISDYAKSSGESDWPDMQQYFIGAATSKRHAADFSRVFNIPEALLKPFYEGTQDQDSFQIQTVVSRPKSRGTVKLRSTDPMAQVLVDPNYLSDEGRHDINILVEATRRAVNLVNNSATFQNLNARLHETPFPPCAKVPFQSDAYWECHIRHFTTTKYHPVGTCAMGRLESGNAVVDSEFRVFGIENLRVIDASVMPTIPTGGTNAPTMLIGEVGAYLLQKTYGQVKSS